VIFKEKTKQYEVCFSILIARIGEHYVIIRSAIENDNFITGSICDILKSYLLNDLITVIYLAEIMLYRVKVCIDHDPNTKAYYLSFEYKGDKEPRCPWVRFYNPKIC
jgi:hypothetical protein